MLRPYTLHYGIPIPSYYYSLHAHLVRSSSYSDVLFPYQHAFIYLYIFSFFTAFIFAFCRVSPVPYGAHCLNCHTAHILAACVAFISACFITNSIHIRMKWGRVIYNQHVPSKPVPAQSQIVVFQQRARFASRMAMILSPTILAAC